MTDLGLYLPASHTTIHAVTHTENTLLCHIHSIAFEQEFCQTIDVSSETGLVSQDAVKPSEVLAYILHHYTDIDHGKQSAETHDMPLPGAKEDKTEKDRQDN